ncbi:hypothetical protein KIK84_13915 [Curvibacter sp. CHRR-16]|uniref:hypothetical protein n=1 Tax=Curvibacter sp. CHRR-16 TaxID=2835872 RepID=UPI001BDB1907|nr:hypothetical protein [Curvibacter sp. CHRR-16]MBT0571422.1 hypothetical protein [Curvibacter sp. CHRR-16]
MAFTSWAAHAADTHPTGSNSHSNSNSSSGSGSSFSFSFSGSNGSFSSSGNRGGNGLGNTFAGGVGGGFGGFQGFQGNFGGAFVPQAASAGAVVSAVPEVDTLAMMAAGLVVVGVAVRRRKQQA